MKDSFTVKPLYIPEGNSSRTLLICGLRGPKTLSEHCGEKYLAVLKSISIRRSMEPNPHRDTHCQVLWEVLRNTSCFSRVPRCARCSKEDSTGRIIQLFEEVGNYIHFHTACIPHVTAVLVVSHYRAIQYPQWTL